MEYYQQMFDLCIYFYTNTPHFVKISQEKKKCEWKKFNHIN